MKTDRDKKLYIVEFGRPNIRGMSHYSPFARIQEDLCVMANSHDEAADKAFVYATAHQESQGVINSQGDLVLGQKDEAPLQVVSVRLACDKIIW